MDQGNTAISFFANILKLENTDYLFCYPANLQGAFSSMTECGQSLIIEPVDHESRTERTTVNMADGDQQPVCLDRHQQCGRKLGVVVTVLPTVRASLTNSGRTNAVGT